MTVREGGWDQAASCCSCASFLLEDPARCQFALDQPMSDDLYGFSIARLYRSQLLDDTTPVIASEVLMYSPCAIC